MCVLNLRGKKEPLKALFSVLVSVKLKHCIVNYISDYFHYFL